MGLPDPNNPQKGDRFTYRGHVRTILERHRDWCFVEYEEEPDDPDIASVDYIAQAWTPVPPPTPGPDELWAAVFADGRAFTYDKRSAAEYHQVDVVRYVKADPQ